MAEQIKKIYNLEEIGGENLLRVLAQINKEFEQIKRTKQNLNKESLKASFEGDSEAVQKLKEQLDGLKVKEAELKIQRQQLVNEIKQGQLVRQQELAQQRQVTSGNNAIAGSYYEINKRYRELSQIAKTTIPLNDTLQVEEAQRELRELKVQLDSFNRSLSPDGTLVGEYKTGIINAFKQAGLDDLINNQLTKGKQKVTELDREFEKLQQELSQIRVTGQGSLEVVERQLIENREAALQLTQQLDRMGAEMRENGTIGTRITEGLNQGFNKLKGQIGSMVLQYIGFQAAFSALQSQISEGMGDAKQFAGVEEAFKRLNDPNLLSNLRKATRDTVDDLNLMKAAVQANNFQIPIENLGNYFEFARQRARDTGESVDYLVQSIILGIGRKSPLILDNLGISAIRLRESFGGLGVESASVGDVAQAVGKIIQEENAKTGQSIDGVTDQLVKNEAKWKNLRTQLANNFLPIITNLGTAFLWLATAVGSVPFTIVTLAVTAFTVAITANYISMQIASKQGLAYAASLVLQNTWTRIVTASTWLWNAALNATPIGWIRTGIILLVGALVLLAKSVKAATTEQTALNKVEDDAGKIFTKQIAPINLWMAVLKSAKSTVEQKREALRKLIELDPTFQNVLKGQKEGIDKLSEAFFNSAESAKLLAAAYKEVSDAAWVRARAEASSSLLSRAEKELFAIARIQYQLDQAKKSGGEKNVAGIVELRVDKGDLTKEELRVIDKFLSDNKIGDPIQYGKLKTGGDIVVSLKDYDKADKLLDSIREKVSQNHAELFDINQKAQTDFEAYIKARRDQNAKLYAIDIAAWKQQSEDLQKQIDTFKGSAEQQKELDKLVAQKKELDDKISKATGGKEEPYKGSRMSGETKDLIKEIDAETDLLKAALEKRKLEAEISETEYYTELNKITQDGISKKLEVIKSGNAEEKRQRAQLELESIKSLQDTNKKLFDIEQKAIDDKRAAALRAADEEKKRVTDNVMSTELQKAEAQLKYDEAAFRAEEKHHIDVLALESRYRLKSEENEQERQDKLTELTRKGNNDRLNLIKEFFEQAEAAIDKRQNISKSDADEEYYTKRAAIYDNRELTEEQRNEALEELEQEHQAKLLSIEMAGLLARRESIKKQYQLAIISAQEYAEKTAGINAEIASNNAEQAELSFDAWSNSWQKMAKTFERIAKELENLYHQIIQPVIDIDNQRIDNEQRATDAFLEKEKERLKSAATTREEQEAIDKKYEAKKAELDRQYSEKRRQNALKELAIESAIAAMRAYSAGLKQAGGGPLLGLAYAALVGIQYALQRQKIMEQQFRYGDMVPTDGGEFGGNTHENGGTKFVYRGRMFEAEVKELAIINKNSAASNRTYTVTGTPKQIASAINVVGGGKNFAPGAQLVKFDLGGYFGNNIQPPVFRSYYQSSGADLSALASTVDDLRLYIQQVAAAVHTESAKPVILNPNSVTDYQNKREKAVSIGTL